MADRERKIERVSERLRVGQIERVSELERTSFFIDSILLCIP